jgi:anti-sigma B factor antagonist
MSIKVDTKAGYNKVTVDGDMTIYDAASHFAGLKQGVQPDKDIEFNLAGVGEIDSSGLQLLAAFGRQAISNGAAVRFGASSESVAEAITRSRLTVALNCDEQEQA